MSCSNSASSIWVRRGVAEFVAEFERANEVEGLPEDWAPGQVPENWRQLKAAAAKEVARHLPEAEGAAINSKQDAVALIGAHVKAGA